MGGKKNSSDDNKEKMKFYKNEKIENNDTLRKMRQFIASYMKKKRHNYFFF